MLIKRIRTKTRPSTDIAWGVPEYEDYNTTAEDNLNDLLFQDGTLNYMNNTESEDCLSLVQETHFTSVENLAIFLKKSYDVGYDTGNLIKDYQHFITYGITVIETYIFEA
jgi:hypothetical protein